MELSEQRVTEIVERVVRGLMNDGTGPVADAPRASTVSLPSDGRGLFSTADEAVEAAERAGEQVRRGGLELRKKIVAIIRAKSIERAEAWAHAAREDTGMGRVADKVVKNRMTAELTPGVEDLQPRLFKGDAGLHIIDGMPWGLICAVTPSTNPTATVINNGMAMIAAGNTVIFCPHPGAKNCTLQAMCELNAAIEQAGGPANLMVALREPSLRTAQAIMNSDRVKVIAATGGSGVVRAAFESKKKVFAAGPGNPPVLIDESADLARAADMTVKGGSFDNNLPCIAEKVGIAHQKIADEFLRLLEQYRGQWLNRMEAERVFNAVWDGKGYVKECIGQDAAELLRRAGVAARGEPLLIVGEFDRDHPLVQHEQMMPFLPLVRVRSFDEGLELAVQVEHGYAHTAVLHTRNTDQITAFTAAVGTNLQVINGPSYAWAGDEGEGFATMTVTSPTGEGASSPRTWQRQRHICYSGMFGT